MPCSPLAPVLPLWAASYLGCALFLLTGLVPRGPCSLPLLTQLAWLALIGSVPTALVVGAAVRAARARPSVVVVVALAIATLGMALGWEHTDFLLSGPRWVLHPQRALARIAMGLALGLVGAIGWLWLILGFKSTGRARLTSWFALTILAIALLSGALTRYRAYDYSMAQLVFPGGVLSSAVVYALCRAASRWRLALSLAILGMVLGIGSRLDAAWVATAEREVIAHSRAGALVDLYVLPHVAPRQSWADEGTVCPPPRQHVDKAPIGIEADDRRNVIIITVDALRKDMVHALERERKVMPELSRLSGRGVSFENATTTYPATLFAVGSAFTGLSPAELYLSPAMPDTIFTLSRSSVDRQLVVLPDVSWFRLPIVTELLTPGVEADFAPTDAAATRMLVDHLRDARAEGESVMAWIHYYAPHDPYRTHPAHPFGRGRRNGYLSEVAYFDAQLGELMRYLQDDRWLEDTLVVFFSDHGEAIGENGYFGHHVYLDSWMVDVPLVLWHARLTPTRPRVGVSVADVAPTVLHFLGLPQSDDISAQSLFSLSPDTANRASFSEAFPVRGRALFDSFRLPALDDATILDRLRSIRLASKGYEPKGAITQDRHRLVHHRSAGTALTYERGAGPGQRPIGGAPGAEVSKLLFSELQAWEQEQLRRIQCRLRVSAGRPTTPPPR